MASLTRVVAVVGGYSCLAVSAFAQATLADLDGVWRGVYSYVSLDRRPVEFVLCLRAQGDACRGRSEEPNTFGHPSAALLLADVDCRLLAGKDASRLMLRKVYDGTGGQFHAVDYEGSVSQDRRSVAGTWRIGTRSGRFSLAKQDEGGRIPSNYRQGCHAASVVFSRH